MMQTRIFSRLFGPLTMSRILMITAAAWSTVTLAATINPDENSFVLGQPTTQDFRSMPPLIESAGGKSSVILAFDISGSMLVPAYPQTGVSWSGATMTNFDPSNDYYGYFEANANYSYDTSLQAFELDAAGDWNGNFMNWLTMRRVDVARKVMTGGKVEDRASGAPYILEAEVEVRSNDDFTKSYSQSETYSPIPNDRDIRISGGSILFDEDDGNDTRIRISDDLEIGYVTTDISAADRFNPANWVDVDYLNTYSNPVVVVGSMTYAGFNSATAVAANVNTSGFKIGLLEWDSWDGGHTTERLFYVVADRGRHQIELNDGSTIDFVAEERDVSRILTEGQTDSAGNGEEICWETCGVNYFPSAPAVIAGIQTFRDTSDVVAARAFRVNRQRTIVALQEENGADAVRTGSEQVGVIAFERDSGIVEVDGELLEIQTGRFDDVDGDGETNSYGSGVFSGAPIIAASIQTANDTEPVSVRVGDYSGAVDSGQSASSVVLAVSQSVTGDNTLHGAEDVGFLAVNKIDGVRIRIALDEEPTGLIQEYDDDFNFGLTVYNFDHRQNNVNSIVDGSRVNGQTMYPCYWIFDEERRNRVEAAAGTDPYISVSTTTLYDGNTRPYVCIPTSVHTPNDYIIQVIEEYPLVWGTTPIAESLFDVGRMVRQESPLYLTSGTTTRQVGNDPRGVFGVDSTGVNTYGYRWDPYYDDAQGKTLSCKDVYVIHFNDGAPYTDFDDGVDAAAHAAARADTNLYYDIPGDTSGQNNELDSVALGLRYNDCRSDLPGHQSVKSFYVYAALGSNETSNGSTERMREAAARGGFEDANGNNLPDPMFPAEGSFNAYFNSGNCVASEWDGTVDGQAPDCEPDTFFLANNGEQLEDDLSTVFESIADTFSGGSASISTPSVSGVGAVYQADFKVSQSGVRWVGDVYAVMIDQDRSLRSDGNNNDQLDASDPYINSCFNESDKRLNIVLSPNATSRPSAADLSVCSATTLASGGRTVVNSWDNAGVVWSGSDHLSDLSEPQTLTQRAYGSSANERHILTAYHATNSNMTSADVMSFTADNFTRSGNNNVGMLNAATDEQAEAIVNYTRGSEATGLRNRTVNGVAERLGDVIYATPTAVSAPAENVHIRYGDASYEEFLDTYADRRTVIYTGGNDGMIHAFNGGWVDIDDDGNVFFSTQNSQNTGSEINWDLGQEMWAYVPYNVLPHLEYLSRPSYGEADGDHISLVDGAPRVFDAKIFPPSTKHPGGWGTILVQTFRLGGGETQVVANPQDLAGGPNVRTVRPAIVVMDITDPESAPELIGEFSHPDLKSTLAIPAPLTPDEGENWYLMLGSGPDTDPSGLVKASSTSNLKLMLLKLESSGISLDSRFGTSGILTTAQSNAFSGDLVAVDYETDYKDDAVYFGSTYPHPSTASAWSGSLGRVLLDTANPGNWSYTNILDLDGPMPHRPDISNDNEGNVWLYAGTGRLFAQADKTDTSAQYLYGVKEPRQASGSNAGERTYAAIDDSNILDVSNISVLNGTGQLQGSYSLSPSLPTGNRTVQALDTRMRQYQSDVVSGWKRQMTSGERASDRFRLAFGIAAISSFQPTNNECAIGGDAYAYALRFTTGTAWFTNIIGQQDVSGLSYNVDKIKIGDSLTTIKLVRSGQNSAKLITKDATAAQGEIDLQLFDAPQNADYGWRQSL